MTNYEKIKNMTLEEMSKIIGAGNPCDFCVYNDSLKNCLNSNGDCDTGTKEWLKQEVKNDDFDQTELKQRLPDEIVARNL